MSDRAGEARGRAADAADRMAARRARVTDPAYARAEMADQVADVFGPDSVLIGQVHDGTFITPDRFDLVCALLGIDLPETVVALQLQRRHQITVIRTRLEHRLGPAGPDTTAHLDRQAVYITPENHR